VQQLLIVAGAAIIAAAVGYYMQRRKPDAPSAPRSHQLPAQIDRADFVRPDAPWLVAVFTSTTCSTCAKLWQATEALASDDVAVQNIEVKESSELHERYEITAVPSLVVADYTGVCRAAFLGPTTAADLWAKVAELRAEEP